MDTIKINSKLYDYSVEFVDDFKRILTEDNSRKVFVIDAKVYDLYKEDFSFVEQDKVYYMDAIEEKKNMDTVLDIIGFLQKIGVKKDWKIVCFGGGITQDVTTMAANIYLRNVDWVFFPTTLLSMCDSCIGGKCGINFGQLKNQIGVFYPPREIYIDTRFINTLKEEDYLNGWGEILKFSLTDDEAFYDELEREESYIPCDQISYYIHKGLMTKKRIIEEDEFESDLRRVLNYGHTFGHALEAYTHNEVPHGKGVIWGIDVVNFLSWKENLISEEYYRKIKELIIGSFLQQEIVIDDPRTLFDLIKTDKKVKEGVMNFAMLDAKSHLIVYKMPIDEKLYDLFGQYLRDTHECYCH